MSKHAGAKSVLTVARAPALLDESAANALSAPIDMKGYDRVRFIFQIGGMVNGAVLAAHAVESNESNLGNATNMVNAENTSQVIAITNVPNTANNNVVVLDIYGSTKRYVGVYANAETANVTLLGILAERFRGTGVMPDQPSGSQYTSFRAK
jgi:hypothetical protein